MLHTERHVIRADRLFELLDASGLLTAGVKSALLTEYDGGQRFDLQQSMRLFVASLTGLVTDPEVLQAQQAAIDLATDQIVSALLGTGPETVSEWLEWEHPGRASVTRYALAPHAACLRLIVLHSETAAAEPEVIR